MGHVLASPVSPVCFQQLHASIPLLCCLDLNSSSAHEQTQVILVCVRVTACRSSAPGPQLDGCLLSSCFLRFSVFFTSLPTGNTQEPPFRCFTCIPGSSKHYLGGDLNQKRHLTNIKHSARCFCHLVPKPGTMSTVYWKASPPAHLH